MIWKELSKIYPFIRIINAAQLTGESWVGSYKVRNFFDGLSRKEAEKTIYVLDEFDKRMTPSGTAFSNSAGISYTVQNELLRLFDGEDIYFPADEKTKQKELHLSTRSMSFVCLGSFEDMLRAKKAVTPKPVGFGSGTSRQECDYTCAFTPEDLIAHAGIRREIAGRIHSIVQLQPMTSEDYYNILKDPAVSPVGKLEKQYGISISLDDNSMNLLAKQAEENRMGVRYMTSRITEMLDRQLFKDCKAEQVMLSCA